jgi:hypothetical protein
VKKDRWTQEKAARRKAEGPKETSTRELATI